LKRKIRGRRRRRRRRRRRKKKILPLLGVENGDKLGGFKEV